MKYPIGILTTGTLIAAFVLSGCDSPSNQMERAEVSTIEANRDMEVSKSEVEAELQIYREENANRMTEYNQTMEDIKQRIDNESDVEVKDRLETQLDGYEETQLELKRDIDNYRASGRDNWDDFKNSFSNSMDDLGDSLDDFFSDSRTTSSTN